MAIIISTPEQIQGYKDSTALNQSLAKALTGGLHNYNKVKESQDSDEEFVDEPKGYLVIGSAVDILLTGNREDFANRFYVSSIEKKPSETEMQIIDLMLSEILDSPEGIHLEGSQLETLDKYRGSILYACNEMNWQSRWKDDTRVDKIIEVGVEYFEDIKRAYGKTIISQEQYDTINDVVQSLTTHSRTSKYFDREIQERATHFDFYYQLPIYFIHDGIECKALIDLVIVEKNDDGDIISVIPIDLKTMSGPTINFPMSLRSRRYDFQGAWYTMALEYWLPTLDNAVPSYPIKQFAFLVESTTDVGSPLMYKMSDELMHIARHGREELRLVDTNFFDDEHRIDHPQKDAVLIREVKGIDQVLEEYRWYEENGWQEERAVVVNNGVLELDWNGII